MPSDVFAIVFFEDVLAPKEFAGGGIEAGDADFGVEGVDFSVAEGGSGAGAITAFVASFAGVSAAVVAGGAEWGGPFLLTGIGVEGDESLAVEAIFIGHFHDGEGVSFSDAK